MYRRKNGKGQVTFVFINNQSINTSIQIHVNISEYRSIVHSSPPRYLPLVITCYKLLTSSPIEQIRTTCLYQHQW